MCILCRHQVPPEVAWPIHDFLDPFAGYVDCLSQYEGKPMPRTLGRCLTHRSFSRYLWLIRCTMHKPPSSAIATRACELAELVRGHQARLTVNDRYVSRSGQTLSKQPPCVYKGSPFTFCSLTRTIIIIPSWFLLVSLWK
jgi:hypothetical protein